MHLVAELRLYYSCWEKLILNTYLKKELDQFCGIRSYFFPTITYLRNIPSAHRADIWRSFEAKHCSSLCSQSEGSEYCGGQARAENPTKSCPRALVMFATCSWPSLCEQSELQCWRRNRRLCESVQISAARVLLLTIDISILNTLDFFCILNILPIRPSLASVWRPSPVSASIQTKPLVEHPCAYCKSSTCGRE